MGCAARCLGCEISPLGCEFICLELQKNTRFVHKNGHYAACFLPFEDGILNFCVADMCAKVQGKTSELAVFAAFWGQKGRILIQFVPPLSYGIAGAEGFVISYIVVLLLFR